MSEKVDAIIKGIHETNKAINEQWAQIYNGDAYVNEDGLTNYEETFGLQTVIEANYLPTD
ncbi:MAG: hypothetical protein IJW32_02505 [Clostridia bacterium]|nr:hypothetical protein [Clostridia bacterium]